MSLRLDWCSNKAARYACEHWHYSKAMPTPPLISIGVWENDKFIGCILFSRGANAHIGDPYKLSVYEVCELTRVALTEHDAPVSKMISIAIKMIKRKEKKMRLVVSYADANEGHHGGIYQAGNWLYAGRTAPSYKYQDRTGRIWHSRQVSPDGYKKQYGEKRKVVKTTDCTKLWQEGKFRYLMPLDDDMRKQIEHLRQPYPKRAKQAISSDQELAEGQHLPARSILGDETE